MTVRLGQSTIPNAGQGIFARRNIKPGEIVAFYNGLHFAGKCEEEEHERYCLQNVEGNIEGEKAQKCFKNKIKSQATGELIDIPPWLSDVYQHYNATLAHKVNHNFPTFTNAKFGTVEHPRFGAIVIVIGTKFIGESEEIFANYGYRSNHRLIKEKSPWYIEQYVEAKSFVIGNDYP